MIDELIETMDRDPEYRRVSVGTGPKQIVTLEVAVLEKALSALLATGLSNRRSTWSWRANDAGRDDSCHTG